MQENPYFDDSLEPRWHELTPDWLDQALSTGLNEAASNLDTIRQSEPDTVSFASSFLALEKSTDTLRRIWGYSDHLNNVANSKELREVRKKWMPTITEFYTRIYLDPDIYRVLKQFSQSKAAGKESLVRQRFIRETIADFEEAGAHLSRSDKQKLEEIEKELSTLTQTFSDNTLDATNAYQKIVDDPADLAGLPESLIHVARESAIKAGLGTADKPRFLFTLHAPSLIPALRYLDSDKIREELFNAGLSVGSVEPWDNTGNLRKILALRDQKAKLLGKAHFPDLVIGRRMAKDGKTALEFVEDLFRRTQGKFKEENEELQNFRASETGEAVRPLYPWENAYWSEKLRRSQYDFDEEALRPYFSINNVLTGMFRICESLFSIKVIERTHDRPSTWDDDVRFFELHDATTNRHLGSFYTDWFPRANKRSGAWMADLRMGQRGSNEIATPHLGFIAGNMTQPIGDTPALLTHDEVTTVFHEFGHLLHGLLGDVEIRSLNGTHVAWDFVELPSQILENWCWERESLDLFARHWQTDQPIPEKLYQKMKAARNFQAARFQMRQLAFGKLDLDMHLHPENYLYGDLDQTVENTLQGYFPPSPVPYRSSLRQFGHLFDNATGYAAGYYSYKWAEVLEADAFSRFRIEGLLNRDTGMDFRREILSKGNSDEPAVLYRNFMGRDPDPDQLLKQLGLL